MKLIKLLKEFITEWIKSARSINLYYRPYKPNIVGEHMDKD